MKDSFYPKNIFPISQGLFSQIQLDPDRSDGDGTSGLRTILKCVSASSLVLPQVVNSPASQSLPVSLLLSPTGIL